LQLHELDQLSNAQLKSCAELVADELLTYVSNEEPYSVIQLPQFVNKELLKIKTFLGSPYKEMIYKFQVYNFDETLNYLKAVPHGLCLDLIGVHGQDFDCNRFKQCSSVKGSDSASLFMLMQESPALCHLIAQAYYNKTGVELNLELTTHLAIAHVVEKLVALELKYNFKSSADFLTNTQVQEWVACFDRFMNFTMNGFEKVIHFDESKLYETIHMGYEMTEGVKSTPKSIREMWMFEWETNILPELPVNQPSDILKILSALQMNFLDTDIEHYESSDSLESIAEAFYMNMHKHVFAGIQSSPWVQAASN